MYLADPAKVLIAAGIVSNEATLATAKQMLDAALPLLESFLETTIAKGTYLDSFSPYEGEAFGEYRLKNRFVDVDSVVVYSGPSTLNPYSLVAAENLLPATEYSIDTLYGVIHAPVLANFGRNSLVVTYDAGFGKSKEDEDIFAAPDQIASMAVQAAVLAMNVLPTTQANRKDKSGRDVSGKLYSILYQAADSLRRPRMCVQYPSFSGAYD